MLTGVYNHTYFGDPPPPPSQEFLDQLRRASAISTKTTGEAAERAYQQSLAAMKEGRAIAHQRQQELERWFYAPPSSAYSIEFVPKKPNADLDRKMQYGGALLDYLIDQEELHPVLVIYSRCALEAIAAAIYAERVAGIRVRMCPGCKELFEIGSHKEKAYCGDTCKERCKKRRKRDKKALAE